MSEDNHSWNKFHQFLLNYIDVLFTLKKKNHYYLLLTCHYSYY